MSQDQEAARRAAAQKARNEAVEKEIAAAAQQLKAITLDTADKAAATLADFAPKPDAGGKQGTLVMLKTNMFRLTFGGPSTGSAPPAAASGGGRGGRGGRGGKGGARAAPGRPSAGGAAGGAPTIYQYDIVVRGLTDTEQTQGGRRSVLPARLIHEVVQAALRTLIDSNSGVTEQHRRAFAFDGRKIAYTSQRLPLDSMTVDLTLPPKQDLPAIANYPATAPQAPAAADQAGLRPRNFTVDFKLTRQISLDALLRFCTADRQAVLGAGSAIPEHVASALQALEVALRQSQTASSDVIIGGRRFFSASNFEPVPGTGTAIWKGFFQSARPTSLGPVVNLDLSFAAFLNKGTLSELCVALLGRGGGGPGADGGGGGGRGGRGGRGGGGAPRGRGRGGGFAPAAGGGGAQQARDPMALLATLNVADRQALRKHLYGVRIRLLHRPSRKNEMFHSLSPQPATQTTFEKDGAQISVVQYFRNQYNYTVRYPNAPCVKLRGNGGWVPLELCYVVEGNRVPPLALNPTQTAAMMEVARKNPPERQAAVQQLRSEQVRYEHDELLQTWGVSIAHEPVQVQGRQLRAPRVVYGGNKQEPPKFGAWNLMGKQFLRPGQPLKSWAIVNFTNRYPQDISTFGEALRAAMGKLGIQSAPPIYAEGRAYPTTLAVLQDTGKKAFAASGKVLPQLFVCILEAGQASLYEDVKRSCMNLPTPTASQCINVRKANIGGPKEISDQYVANVAMKINVKIGGGNHAIHPQDLPGLDSGTMLMGADVTHPPPGLGLDSIAASVATVDASRIIYGHEVRLQRNPGRGQSQEIILSLKDMVKRHLTRWEQRNKTLPTSLLMFRDGISEGQFAAAKTVEIKAIRDAVQEVRPGHILKLTFIVCGKRHHVRFSSATGDKVDRSGNLLAGTVVDTGVTNPVAFEFFLQAHAGLIGTAKPTRYIILEDDMKFSSDGLQQVVNALCYSYSRATRSVSLPPPAYYSDILAEKARALLWPDADQRSMVTGSSGETERTYEPLEESKARELMTKIAKRPGFDAAQWYM